MLTAMGQQRILLKAFSVQMIDRRRSWSEMGP